MTFFLNALSFSTRKQSIRAPHSDVEHDFKWTVMLFLWQSHLETSGIFNLHQTFCTERISTPLKMGHIQFHRNFSSLFFLSLGTAAFCQRGIASLVLAISFFLVHSMQIQKNSTERIKWNDLCKVTWPLHTHCTRYTICVAIKTTPKWKVSRSEKERGRERQ